MIARKVPIDCPVHAPCLKLNYYDQGAGEPLLFIHGLGGKAASWRFQLEALSNNYRVLAMDLRGHGQSGYRAVEPICIPAFADDVVALMAKLGLEQAHICGLSMGGMIALEIFARYAHKVKSLILADTTAFFPPPQGREELLGHFDRLEMASWAALLAGRILRREAPAELRQEVIQMLAANRRALYRQGLIATFDRDYRRVLPLIDLPTLILVGEEDRATPIGYAEYLQANIRGSVLQVIPQAAHLANLENPAAFNRQVSAHLKRCPGREKAPPGAERNTTSSSDG
ncbi:MAG: alpha/beta fold hydrolase [Deltaproteobacteria bacterium]|nr:alpha/beta fold hydrolase [Deltaproteobacteria bacterium]